MRSRMYLLAGVLFASSYAFGVTASLGSVTARGETRIDNHDVKGSGTVFDGSVVETGQSVSSGADLRLTNSAKITLMRDSRGTLRQDRFVLERGGAQLSSSNLFRVQANGIVIATTEADSTGIVSINPTDSVTVAADSGTFEIRNSAGAVVARVAPGHPLTFSPMAGKSAAEFSAIGTISTENGRYYLSSSETGMKYELKGDDVQNYDGTSVMASGVLQAAGPAGGVAGLIVANSIQSFNTLPLLGQSSQANRALIRGLSISLAAAPNTTRMCPPNPLEDCCPGVPLPQCCNPLPPNECGASK